MGIAACCLLLTASTCAGPTAQKPNAVRSFAGPPYTLRVLASSELADMQPILAQVQQMTDVTVKLTYTGSLAGTQTVLNGRATGRYDAIWFASDNYLALSSGGLAKIDASNQIIYSPVILGLRAPVARRLGWTRRPVSWADITAAAAARKFTFGMTDPAESNSGFSALASAATALAGHGGALQASQIPAAEPALRALFGAQALKRASSGWLKNAYLGQQGACRPGTPAVDGLFEYESVLLSLNASGKLCQPLILIYPSNGVITASYPLSLLASAPPAAKAAYTRLVGYLLTPPVQRQIDHLTRRRPATPGVKADPFLRSHPIYEMPFPGTVSVVNDLLAAYNGQLRRPARTIYLLDTSGSMAGSRIAGLKAALACLTEASTSLAGKLTQFQEREQVTMLPFSTTPGTPVTFNIPGRNPGAVLAQIRAYTASLTAHGWTAIYDSLEAAYNLIIQQARSGPARITTIVLLTDGENNRGDGLRAFTAFYRHLPPATASVPVFAILFGEARLAQMKAIAVLTGGQVFDARAQSLTPVFAAIRGNQ